MKPARDWKLDALCAQPMWVSRLPRDFFFPLPGVNTSEIVNFCSACPVQHDCLDYAIVNHEHHGMWGGKSERERRRIRKNRGRGEQARGKERQPRTPGRHHFDDPTVRSAT